MSCVPRSETGRPGRRAALLAGLACYAVAGPAAELPRALASIEIGASWEAVEREHQPVLLDHRITALDRLTHDCGYRTARIRSDAGELMPQKTTFYYPKLATGMVFRSFD